MLGALALVAVGQEQGKAAGLAPLGLGGGQELVDDDLGAVGEVAELGLPQDQGPVIHHRVAELEAHHGRLGEQAVEDLELAARRGHGVERHVLLARLDV